MADEDDENAPCTWYPLVNIQKTMENHHAINGKPTISMAIFNSYVDITRGYVNHKRSPLSPLRASTKSALQELYIH